MTDFYQTLSNYILTADSKSRPNYTTFTNDYKKSFYISQADEATFLKLYTKAAFSTFPPKNYAINQLHKTIRLLKIDLDFKWVPMTIDPFSGTDRPVNDMMIGGVLNVYRSVIKEIYGNIASKIYVCPRPVVDTKMENGTKLYYDGLHLEFTNIGVTKETAEYIREKASCLLANGALYNYKQSITKILDIPSGWMLYGSGKKVQYLAAYAIDLQTGERSDVTDHGELVAELSSTNRPETQHSLTVTKAKVLHIEHNNTEMTNETVSLIKECLKNLKNERTSEYELWIQVGFILGSASYHDARVYNLWLEFSKRSPKFEKEKCDQIWASAKPGMRGIPELYKMVKEDNPETYKTILEKDYVYQIMEYSLPWTAQAIADIFVKLHGDKFKVNTLSRGKYDLYQFKDHIWRKYEHDTSLAKLIKTDITPLFVKAAKRFGNKIPDATANDDVNVAKLQSRNKSLLRVIRDLGSSRFKGDIIKEIFIEIEDNDFVKKLNMNPYLFVFSNGVFDLAEGKFRPGRPDDYMSLQTQQPYIPFDPENPITATMLKCIKEILPVPQVFHYCMQRFAMCLTRNSGDPVVCFITGSGSNGKSLLIDLARIGFDTYYGGLNMAYYTTRRQNSSNATNELNHIEFKRMIISSETNIDEKLNCAIFKDITGGNPLQTRGLYEKTKDTIIMGRIFMQVNHLPKLDHVDAAMIRRIRVIPFDMKFIDQSSGYFDPKIHKPANPDNYMAIHTWARYFMSYLVHVYLTEIKNKARTEPDEVKLATHKYILSNDNNRQFSDQIFDKTGLETDTIHKTAIYTKYRFWALKFMKGMRIMNMIDFEEHLCSTYKELYKDNMLIGYKFKPEFDELFYKNP